MTEVRGAYKPLNPTEDATETERLKRQAAAQWGRECELLRHHGLVDGSRLLDLGCGPAFILRQLVTHTRPALAIGVDRDGVHLGTANGSVPLVRAVAEQLPLAANQFSFVLVRLVLRHVPDPSVVLREAVRVTAPGGRVCVVDADDATCVLDQPPSQWDRLNAALLESARRLGSDPWVGRALQRRLMEAGLTDVRVSPWPVQSADISAPAFVELVLAPAARPVDPALMDREEAASAWAALREWARQPEAYACMLAFVASGVKAGGAVGP